MAMFLHFASPHRPAAAAALMAAACLTPHTVAQPSPRFAAGELAPMIEGVWTYDAAFAAALERDNAVSADITMVLDVDEAAAEAFAEDPAELREQNWHVHHHGRGWAVEGPDDQEPFVFALATDTENGGFVLLVKEEKFPEYDPTPIRLIVLPGDDAQSDHLMLAGRSPMTLQRADADTTQQLADQVGAQLE